MTGLSERRGEKGAPLVLVLVGLTLCVCGLSLFARVCLSGRGVCDSLIYCVLPSSVLSRLQSSVSLTLLLRQPGQPDRTDRPFFVAIILFRPLTGR